MRPNWRLLHADQVNHEDESLARLDHAARAPVAVPQVRRNRQLAAATDLHAGDALVPPRDHTATAERERERLAPVPGRVELLPGRVRYTDIVDGGELTRSGLRPVAERDVLDDQVGRW